jgi:cytochrome P450
MTTETINSHPARVTRTGGGFHDFKKASPPELFPRRFADYVRSYGELYFWEKGNFHVITRAAHAREILTSSAFTADRGSFFVSRMPNLDLALVQDFFGVVKKMMVMSDDDDHARRRRAAAVGFEDHILERFKAVMARTVRDLVASVKGQPSFEFVAMISKRLPATVLADLFSIPHQDRENFLRWSNVMTGFFGGASQYRNEDGVEVNDATRALKAYFTTLVEERRRAPADDYVSLVLRMQAATKLGDDELISQLIMMLVAGMATTTDQINNCMFLLASHPEIQAEVQRDPGLGPGMLEEFKRLDPAVTFIFRVARARTVIGGQDILPGDVVFISSHAINRDLPASERPEEIDIRRRAPNFAYGHGAHYCIGAKLARMEMQALFEELLRELPPFRVSPAVEPVRDHYSLSFSGFSELTLELA